MPTEKIPDSFNIRFCGFNLHGYLRSEKYLGGDEGHWYLDEHMILVQEDLPEQRKWEALWHELIHAISDIKGLGLSETAIRDLSLSQFQILRDNPFLTDILVSCIQK